nr:DUF5054 domain-containing protein [bacterium]
MDTHVIFKTHLDIGYTDFASSVIRGYVDEFIPHAIALARQMRGREQRFIWTTGSWLIDYYLRTALPSARRELEAAIEAGDISWHALPFTSHTEYMDETLFRYGLDISRRLDKRFGITTIAAKMTDVPGHTQAMIPYLKEAGIRFLHIGVNSACSAPDVPDFFTWRYGGDDLLVMYHKSGYGSVTALEDKIAIAFAHTNDNNGPQSRRQISAVYRRLHRDMPNAALHASSLNDFAKALTGLHLSAPVVEQEIGDTWIHGCASDPAKTARYRAMLRQNAEWARSGRIFDFTDTLLLVPEHTCGMCIQRYLADTTHYTVEDLDKARKLDNFRLVEASWQEQRQYIEDAAASLPQPQRSQADAALADTQAHRPDTAALKPFDWQAPLQTGPYRVYFSEYGEISGLRIRGEKTWRATSGHRIGGLRYHVYSHVDGKRYSREYCTTHPAWAYWDLTKKGLEQVPVRRGMRRARATHAWHLEDGVLFQLAFPDECREYGPPQEVFIAYHFLADKPGIRMEIQWFNKRANRIPEAFSTCINPVEAAPDTWRIRKLGHDIDPMNVVPGGGRSLHATDGLVHSSSCSIQPIDSALVAPGGLRLWHFDKKLPNLEKGMEFLLYDNMWNTNFPLWYSDDAKFRFDIVFTAPEHAQP